MYRAVEVVNKNIKYIIQKMVETYKDLHEILPFSLHDHETSVGTSTRLIHFSLVYGMEVVLPIEFEIPSMRFFMETNLKEAKWV